jgi:hypothetical protein
MDREKVGDVEPECVTDADGLSVPEPQDEALLEGEGVPVEVWLAVPEREASAEGVDTVDSVAVGVDNVVSVLLTLGDGDADTVADGVLNKEGVGTAEGVAEKEATGVLERVAVGDSVMEGEGVPDAVATAEPVDAAVPVVKKEPLVCALPEGSMVGEGESE